MAYQPFPIYDLRSGIDLAMEPWKTPADAFTEINNGYTRRGILRKRAGQSVFGQLGKYATETIDPNPSATAQTGTFTDFPVIPGSVIITAGAKEIRDDRQGGLQGDVDTGETNTIDYTTGDYAFTFDSAPGAVDTDAEYHYQVAENVRGLFYFDRYTGSDLLVGVQTKRVSVWIPAYDYFDNIPDGGGLFDHFNSTGLVSAHAFNDVLWITTNEATDNIWTFNGTTMTNQTSAGILNLNAGGTEKIYTARHVFSWKERLYFLNTVDGAGAGTRHPQRAIYSWAGNPLTAGAWQWDVQGRGGYVDAATNEEIIDFAFLGDQPIVGFEESIWTLDYTSDPNLPAVWRKLPSILQISSSHGRIEYDNLVTFVGGKGLVGCNQNSSFLYNKKIPDFAYEIDLSKISLCYSIRDDSLEQGILSYPDNDADEPNNRMLIYNFEDESFCKYTMNAKCFGRWEVEVDKTFNHFPDTTFDELSALTWGDHSLQAGFPMILTGWQNGYVYRINDEEMSQDADTWDEYLELNSESPNSYNFEWKTGRLNPFIQTGNRAVFGRLELFLSHNDDCEFSIDLYSDNYVSPHTTLTVNCSTDDVVDKVWKTIPIDHEANFHRMKFYLSDSQLAATAGKQQVTLHGMILWMEPGGEIL